MIYKLVDIINGKYKNLSRVLKFDDIIQGTFITAKYTHHTNYKKDRCYRIGYQDFYHQDRELVEIHRKPYTRRDKTFLIKDYYIVGLKTLLNHMIKIELLNYYSNDRSI